MFGGLAACGGDPSEVVFKQVFVEIDRTSQFVNINFFLDVNSGVPSLKDPFKRNILLLTIFKTSEDIDGSWLLLGVLEFVLHTGSSAVQYSAYVTFRI